MSHLTPSRSSTLNNTTGSPAAPSSSLRSSKLLPSSTRLHYGITGSPTSGASPQVKARIAELRRAKEAAAAAANKTEGDASGDGDDSVSERRSSGLAVSTNDGAGSRLSSRASMGSVAGPPLPSPAGSEVTVELEMKGLDKAINAAKTSGRLNIASRSLAEIPIEVYEELVPRGSPYHPSNSKGAYTRVVQQMQQLSLASTFSPQTQTQASTSSSAAIDSETAPKWWEYADLTVIKASSNELTSIPEEIAGFDALAFLDMHNNAITSPLPASLGTLSHLTSLKLSGNQLTEWPIEIMALVHLQELDLSANKLKELWPRDAWRDRIRDRLKTVKKGKKRGPQSGADPDTSIDSIDSSTSTVPDSDQNTDFWSTFPSSPTKPHTSVAYSRTVDSTDYTAPLPKLRTLKLANNSFRASAFSASQIDQLPPSLVSIDLSSNGLNGPIPLALFGTLRYLQDLNLANNGLDDAFFRLPPFPSIPEERYFPTLEKFDISRNAIDSLEHLEKAFGAPQNRKINYTGITSVSLKKYLALVPEPTSQLGTLPTLSANVGENFLREEGARRKAMRKEAAATAAPDTSSNDGMASPIPETSVSDTEVRLQTMLSQIEAFRAALSRELDAPGSVSPSDLARWEAAVAALSTVLPTSDQPLKAADKLRTGSMIHTPPVARGQQTSSRKSVLTPSRPARIVTDAAEQDASSTSWSARRKKLQEATYDWAPL